MVKNAQVPGTYRYKPHIYNGPMRLHVNQHVVEVDNTQLQAWHPSSSQGIGAGVLT